MSLYYVLAISSGNFSHRREKPCKKVRLHYIKVYFFEIAADTYSQEVNQDNMYICKGGFFHLCHKIGFLVSNNNH